MPAGGEKMAQEALITDYFYGDESEQFSYFRVPRLLITSPRFKGLSTDAKLLYGMLLDRMSLSAKNGWYDEQSRVYIYYTADEIRTDMGCGNDKALKLLSELDTKKGVGLIERIKQGQGKPTKIYVKRFTTRELPADTAEPSAQCPDTGRGADIDFSDFQTSEKSMSRPRQSRCADLGKPMQVILIEINLSLVILIHLSNPTKWRWSDTSAEKKSWSRSTTLTYRKAIRMTMWTACWS